MVLGLAKAPKRVTKKYLKKLDEKTKNLESALSDDKKKGSAEKRLAKLKKLGIFLKTYNMNHILATRYKVSENFGIENHLGVMEKIEEKIKGVQSKLNEAKNKDENSDETKKLSKESGEIKTELKSALNDCKVKVGEELYNRYMKGFVKTRDNLEENEKITSAEFLFTKLKF